MTPGDKLGPYELLAPLGEGGMGEVWKARDTRLDRTAAVKVAKADFTDRFEREARAVAALNHPNTSSPLARAIEYAGQILDTLDAAHRKWSSKRAMLAPIGEGWDEIGVG